MFLFRTYKVTKNGIKKRHSISNKDVKDDMLSAMNLVPKPSRSDMGAQSNASRTFSDIMSNLAPSHYGSGRRSTGYGTGMRAASSQYPTLYHTADPYQPSNGYGMTYDSYGHGMHGYEAYQEEPMPVLVEEVSTMEREQEHDLLLVNGMVSDGKGRRPSLPVIVQLSNETEDNQSSTMAILLASGMISGGKNKVRDVTVSKTHSSAYLKIPADYEYNEKAAPEFEEEILSSTDFLVASGLISKGKKLGNRDTEETAALIHQEENDWVSLNYDAYERELATNNQLFRLAETEATNTAQEAFEMCGAPATNAFILPQIDVKLPLRDISQW
jgi:hypothetical protein